MGILSSSVSITQYRVEGKLSEPILENVATGLKKMRLKRSTTNHRIRPLVGLVSTIPSIPILINPHLSSAPIWFFRCGSIKK